MSRRSASVLGVLDRAVQVLCVSLAVVIVFAIVGQVLARYVTSDSTPWAAELATYAFVWLTMLSIPLGVRRGRHMSLDVWEYIRTPRWLDRTIETFVLVVVIVVLGVLAWSGIATLGPALGRITPGLGVPYALVTLAVPVGCVLSIVFAIEAYITALRSDDLRAPKAARTTTLCEPTGDAADQKGAML